MQKPQPTFWPDQIDAHRLLVEAGVGRTTEDYRRNQTIFMQGERADLVFFIQSGRVKLTVTSELGKEAVIGMMEAGQFFGEACLHDNPLRTATAVAFTDSRITSIRTAATLAALRDEPKFAKLFMDHLLSRNSRIQEDVIDQLFNSSEKRLARLLCLLANYGKKGSPPIVPVVVNQETLAEMICTTRSRVSFFMNKFRNSGFIDYEGTINVHPSLLDNILHDKPEIRLGEADPD